MHGRRQLQDIPLQMSSRQFKELVGSSSEHLELIHQYVETTKFMKNIKDQIQFNKNLLSSYYIWISVGISHLIKEIILRLKILKI